MKFGRIQNGLLRSQPETAPSNFISNPTPLKDTTGWSLYSDAAGTAPADGTGGSVNTGTEINWSRTTSSPLSETASFLFSKIATSSMQGKGVSYDFTINRADQAKVCRIDFDYEVVSGTYADGDLTVWLYDVTNAQLIQPSASSILNAVGPQKKQPLSFQTNSNSTSYRLIIHVASTSASAYTVKFDSVSVTRESISHGTFNSSQKAYTPTLTSSGGGAITLNATGKVDPNGFYWQEGQFLCGQVSFRNGSGGAASGSAGVVLIGLPPGLSVDPSLVVTSVGGVRVDGDADVGTTTFTSSNVYAYSTTQLAIMPNGFSAYMAVSNLAASFYTSIRFKVPILGWSSSQQLSSDAETRVVAAKYSLTSDETTAANADHIMTNFTTKVFDTHGAMSSSRFTAPVPGIYRVRVRALTNNHSWTTSDIPSMYLAKNGSTQSEFLHRQRVQAAFTDRIWLFGEASTYLAAGEYVEVNIRNATAGTVPVIFAGLSFYEVERISGPAQIAASEIVTGHYGGGTASVGNGVTSTLVMTTKVFDSHGSTYNTSTGVWTCPAPGKYQFIYQASGGSDISATAVANNVQFGLTVDGAGEYGVTTDIACITSARRFNGRNTFILNLQAGQQVRFYASNGLGSGVTWTMLNNVNYSYFQWHRIGGVG